MQKIDLKTALICMVFWSGSYLVPLYFLPITMFVPFWLAALTWGVILCSGIAVSPEGANEKTRLMKAVFTGTGLAGFLAYIFNSPIDTVVLLVAIAVFFFGFFNTQSEWTKYLFISLVVSAVISVLIALIQLCFPGVNFEWIAPLANPTRATANLRQPNLFAQLLLMSMVGLVFLRHRLDEIPAWIHYLFGIVLGAGLAFSQSRMGFLGLLMLVVWSFLNKGLHFNSARRILLLVAVGYGVTIAAMLAIAHGSGQLTHLEVQQTGGADISASRFGIWKNTLNLIAMYPLEGVGWGNFAKAWALTPFPSRPTASFDHAHNLPLHLIVELGLPLALGLILAAGVAFWRARVALNSEWLGVEKAFEARCLLMVMGLLLFHSMLEYPLWFPTFLLPVAFIAGRYFQFASLARKAGRRETVAPVDVTGDNSLVFALGSNLIKAMGILIVLGSFYAAWDYARIVQVFRPFGYGVFRELEDRVADGRKSFLFGYWVDYIVVTNEEESFKALGEEVQNAFRRRMNPHMLLVYAKYLNERGEVDKASYVAERLKEFRNPVAKEFFAACDNSQISQNLFQCRASKGKYSFKDFN